MPSWEHQDRAIEEFLRARRGLLEMATGTGKTRTALRIAEKLVQDREVDSVIITAAGTDLLDQWARELRLHPHVQDLILYRHYGQHHDVGQFTLASSGAVLICSRLSLPSLRAAMAATDKPRTLIIHDEAHGFGSPLMRQELDGFHSDFAAVLGLSATPEREYDEEGNDFIEQEIGPVLFRFEIEHAIGSRILCPFNYVQVEYALTDGDRRRLQAVIARREAAAAAGRPMPEEEVYRELARVYKTAEEKPSLFDAFVAERPELLRSTIVFAETQQFAEQLLDSIGRTTTAYSTYFGDDPPARLVEFSARELDCLVCCKRLSEGIDIRHLRNVILVSSDRGRLQTIQRIGRTLRTDPADPDKIASVVDFVWADAPPDHADTDRRAWLDSLSSVRP